MKKRYGLLFLLPLTAGFLVNFNDKNAVKTDAFFYKTEEYSDDFSGDLLNPVWEKSNGTSLVTDYASLQVNPDSYEWGGQIVLNDFKVEGSISITYDFESIKNGAWFAFSFGNPNKSSPFFDAQAAFIFCNDLTQYFNHVDKEILNDTFISYPFSPIKAVESERCYVNVKLEKQTNSNYLATLSILDRAKTVLHKEENIEFPNVDGYIGFNSNFSSAEIYSIDFENLSGEEVYKEDFLNSSCSFPTKSETGAKWSTNTFKESELKIGKKNKLAISKVDDYATYNIPFSLPENKDIDLLYTLSSKIYLGSQDLDIDTGFEIGKTSIDAKGHFIGVRKKTFGFSLVCYDSNSQDETILTTVNERPDLCVDLKVSAFRTGKIEITANELIQTINLKKSEGYFGFATRKHAETTGTNGGRICSFSYEVNSYRDRSSEDMAQNFNGLKSTVDNNFTYYDFFYNKEIWYTGENVKLSMYKSQMKGNGYVAFTNSSPYSAIGPRTKFAEAIVRFDVEFTSSLFKNGACLGLQFAKQNVGTIFQNCPSLGLYCSPDENNPTGYRTLFYTTSCNFAEGYSELMLDSQGNSINLFEEGGKYTFLYVIKDGEISMSYKSIDEDETALLNPKIKAKLENTDGYIAVYGANGMSFNVDNISIVNLDHHAAYTGGYLVEGHQAVTRYDFATGNNFDAIALNNASVEKGALKIKENGNLSTAGTISSNIVRFKTKNIEDTLRVKRGNITVDLVAGNEKKIIVSDGVNTSTRPLDKDFSFAGASFEIENFGTTIKVSYVSGLDAFSSIYANQFIVQVNPDLTYSKLTISAVNGIVSLSNFAVFNLDSYVEIITVNYDPEKDQSNPWPERPSIDDVEIKKGCKGSIIATSSIITLLSIVSIALLLAKKNKFVEEN